MVTIEDKLQIRSHSIVRYKKFSGHSHLRTDLQKLSGEKLKDRITYSGKMSPGAKKRLIKAIELMVQSTKRKFITNHYGRRMPFQLAFTTLTIHSPERMIGGKEAHKNLLSPFLQWLRRVHNCNLYIWKAELQQRGQLHYHLLLGTYIPQEDLQNKWNELQQQHGYLDEYFKVKGHYNAPSTKIHNALEHVDVAGYLIKEVAKTMQNIESVGGKVWDCSANLKELSYFEADANIYSDTLTKLVRTGSISVVCTDKCVLYKANFFNTIDLLNGLDRFLYKDHLEYISNYNIDNRIKQIKPVVSKFNADDWQETPPGLITVKPRNTLFALPNETVWGTALCAKLIDNIFAN